MTSGARKFSQTAARAATAAKKAARHVGSTVKTVGVEAECPYGCGGTMSLAAGQKVALLHSEPACRNYAAMRTRAGATMSVLAGLATLLAPDPEDG